MISSKILSFCVILVTVDYSASFGFLGLRNNYFLQRKNILRQCSVCLYARERWMTQPLDHFDTQETRVWKMKYYENLTFLKPGGPIFIFIGGEGPASPYSFEAPLFQTIALLTKGAMFVTEHRYYGDSIPLPGWNVESLQYLSSKQALADVKNFIVNLKSYEEFKESKVVVFGGSYSGNLAAWMRLLYPDIVDAALASSAPVLAKVNFIEYVQVVENVIEKYDPVCYYRLAEKFNKYEQLIKTPEGIQQLKEEEKICANTDMTVPNNIALFLSSKIVQYSYLVQYGTPEIIKSQCNSLLQFTDGEFWSNYSDDEFWANLYDEFGNCHNFDFNTTSTNIGRDRLSWTYQVCTEFGYFQTSWKVPLDFYIDLCRLLFGPQFDQKNIEYSVQNTNERYQGLEPKVEKVFFLQGDMDPWRMLGISEDLSNEAPARVLVNISHCAGLNNDLGLFIPENIMTMNYVVKLLMQWIEFKP